MRRASQIQVATEAEAKALLAKLKRGDREGFARLAREHSSDTRTQRQGGELGYFDAQGKVDGRASEIPAPIVAAAFKLKQAELSGPIAHDGVYSLVLVTGEMSALAPKRAAVEAQLRGELARAQQQRAVEALVAQLRAEAKPEVHPELLDRIVLPPAAALDFPQGFAAAPSDPRAPPRTVEPDGY
jgi:parvulin-like peptidyl-prolyl isomerase